MKLLITLIGIFALTAQVNAQCAAFATATATGNPGEFIFDNQSTADPSAIYILDTGDGNLYTMSGFLTSITNLYTVPGAYYWCITVYDSVTPCNDTYCDSIYINGLPTNCDATFTSNANPVGGSSIDFTGNASVGIMDHYWDFGDGGTSILENPVHTYAANGTYLVCHTVTETSGNCTDTFCDSVTVSGGGGAFCGASYFWYQDSSTFQTVNVFNTSYGTGTLTYLWDFGDGTTSTGAYPTHTYNALGGYTVCLTITDAAGCTSTYCDSVYITFKMQGFTINVYSASVAGIDEVENDDLSVYPNPADDWLFVESEENATGASVITIVDLQGNVVYTEKRNAKIKQLDVSRFDAGIYFLRVDNGMPIRFVKK